MHCTLEGFLTTLYPSLLETETYLLNEIPVVCVLNNNNTLILQGSAEAGKIVMSEFPKVCKYSSTQAISPQCLNVFTSNLL